MLDILNICINTFTIGFNFWKGNSPWFEDIMWNCDIRAVWPTRCSDSMNLDPNANVNTDKYTFDRQQPFTSEPVSCSRDWEQTWVKRNNPPWREIQLWCENLLWIGRFPDKWLAAEISIRSTDPWHFLFPSNQSGSRYANWGTNNKAWGV